MHSLLLILSLAVAALPPNGPDTLVVCPKEFRSALTEWEQFRSAQGHEIAVVGVPETAKQLKATIRRANQSGSLKYIVIIGDEPTVQDSGTRGPRVTVPTNYVPGKVNIRWGPEKEIASDTPYGDLDGDGEPDVAVGRIPAHSAAQLSAVFRKVIRYESLAEHGAWEWSLSIVSGAGGFGAVADAMIQAAGRQVVQQTVPSEYNVQHITVGAAKADGSEDNDFVSRARNEFNGGGLAWIYVGHGLPTDLVYAPTATGFKSVFSIRDVPQLHCGPHNPLAVLVACYTGAMDAPRGCLAEEMLLAEDGPVAVIAATRVTMPYGNTVIGCELLRACFRDQPDVVGDVLRLAQQRTLASVPSDQLRATLDGMAQVLSPPPVDLEGERREHVLMYQLIGDPLLRLHRPATGVARRAAVTDTVK